MAVLGEDAELAKRFARHLGVEDTAEGRWTIDNEYYVAKTRVVVSEVLDAGPIVRDAKAIVLVFEGGKKGSFQEIKQAYESWEGQIDADVRLCVCHVGPESNREHEEELHWCVDAGFELVFAAIGERERDEALHRDDEGCSGVERVRIALASESWPGMQRKPRAGPEGQGRKDNLEQEDTRQEVGREGNEAEEEDDPLMDMEAMIRKIRSAKDTSANKSDDERRKEAEEMVYSLMSLMGLDADEA